MYMVITLDETRIQMFADWSKSHDLEQYAKFRILCRCRGKETAERQKLSRGKYMTKALQE